MTEVQWRRSWRGTFARPGTIIMERHKKADPRRVVEFHSGEYVICEGLYTGRRTRVMWKTLFRYDCVERVESEVA